MKHALLSLALLLAFITACAPLTVTTPPPEPQVVRVTYSATLRPWVDALHACARQTPEIALIIDERSLASPDLETADLTLWFGEPPQGYTGTAFNLGADEIVILAGSNLNSSRVSLLRLREIYSGAESDIQPWSYGQGSDIRLIFDQVVLAGAPPSLDVLLAPNPAAMLEAIAANPSAIGYVPKSWLSGDVQPIAVDGDAFWQPVLALTATEPQGGLRDFIACLQTTAE